MRIGERIKQRRLELGYTADALAKLLNKNRATIYRYENNLKDVCLNHLSGYFLDKPTLWDISNSSEEAASVPISFEAINFTYSNIHNYLTK